MAVSIDKLIINSPHQEPQQYWYYDREKQKTSTLKRAEGRQAMLWLRQIQKPLMIRAYFVEIDTVNKIRPRVAAWRESGYPGVTGITKTAF
jgi:type III restriction enzyme